MHCMANPDQSGSSLSIAIKCFNEEHKIAAAIESALAAGRETGLPFEVVLADSCSTDRTVDIARRYPVRVVQLAQAQDRGCGAGTELAYAHSRGDLVFLMDGDMQLIPGFLPAAVAHLQSHPELGGVAGLLSDERMRNAFDRLRRNNRPSATPGVAKHLGGGGLYKRQAIDAAGGHAADRNLKGYEEAELGMRMQAAGWQLQRLPIPGVSHVGHDLGTWALLARHWRSGRAQASGMLLRGAFGRPWFGAALRLLMHPLAMLAWWLLAWPMSWLWLPLPWALASGPGLPLFLVLVLWWRKRDLQHALVSVVHWHYGAAAIVAGLVHPRVDPGTPLPVQLLHDGASAGGT